MDPLHPIANYVLVNFEQRERVLHNEIARAVSRAESRHWRKFGCFLILAIYSSICVGSIYSYYNNNEFKALHITIRECSTKNAALYSEIEALRFDGDALFSRFGAFSTDNSALKNEVSTLQTDNSALKNEVSALKNKVSNLENNLSDLMNKFATFEAAWPT